MRLPATLMVVPDIPPSSSPIASVKAVPSSVMVLGMYVVPLGISSVNVTELAVAEAVASLLTLMV